MRAARPFPPLAIAAALLLGGPASGLAALPHPVSHRIVPGRSIGGVRIGQTVDAARGAWGPGWTCIDKVGGTCSWITIRDGVATLQLRAGRVAEIAIAAGISGTAPRFDGPLATLRTASGIGIGSAAADVRAAYPRARSAAGALLLVADRRVTAFKLAGGRVTGITVRRAR